MMPEAHPYKFTTNSQGFRSLKEFSHDIDTINILCLGDSFTMGWGVNDDDTYPEQLSSILSKKYPNTNFNVINAGRLFSNILDQIDYFREKGKFTHPDIVIFQYYFNDLPEMVAPYVNAQVARKILKNNTSNNFLSSLYKKSSIYNFAVYLKYKYILDKKLPTLDNAIIKDVSSTDIHKLLIQEPTKEESMCLGDWDQLLDEKFIPCLDRFWEGQVKAILKLKAEVEENGGIFILMAIPNMDQLEKYKNAHSGVFNNLEKTNEVHFLDILPIFRNAIFNKASELYLENDEHTNQLGNTIIARSIADRIELSSDGKILFLNNNIFNSFASPHKFSIYAEKDTLNFLSSSNQDLLTFKMSNNAEIKFGGIHCGLAQLCPLPNNDRFAEFDINIKTANPVKYLYVRTNVKLLHSSEGDPTIKLVLHHNNKEYVLFDYHSNKNGSTDSNETVKILEFVFPSNTNEFNLTYLVNNHGMILTENNPNCDPSRRIEFYCYPENDGSDYNFAKNIQ